MRICLFFIVMSFSIASFAQVKGYPEGVEAVTYQSNADQSMQPALFWKPEANDEAIPLLVALHTWSGDYRQAGGEAVYAKWCQQMGWAFVHPNFRGKNNTQEALGSDLAVQDVLSAIDFSKTKAKIDPNRIYCIGVSGGGHMSLMMAARAPDVWAGVSAWCGISDIAAWHQQCSENERFNGYAKHIEQALGGAPASSTDREKSAKSRSPLSWLNETTRKVNFDINHGINDGRDGSVPFTHSLYAWNEVVPEGEQLSAEFIIGLYADQTVPADQKASPDAIYGKRQPLLRKTHDNTRITIFDGGHEIIHEAALNWLAAQRKDKPAVWDLKDVVKISTKAKDSESGK